jgi:hypothetical protein
MPLARQVGEPKKVRRTDTPQSTRRSNGKREDFQNPSTVSASFKQAKSVASKRAIFTKLCQGGKARNPSKTVPKEA